ncbi:FAD-dependent oxidoreductase [Microbacterium betulae]|uniref:FAD-dependent oxidoreductase n=1 Tax=Microbacterium betulae TaxID=2981139 RepID=A0AA97I6Y7_9MICO|nr:FAD-dependent oxidoreductase [Microbacterium sp. AB]WOF22875.1 FAD-dependent oxidoreductase [Microbacterium sp. AB]
MTETFDADVVIIGGGPVGLTAAMDLDARGIRSVVIESRRYLEAPNVKCNHVASRTMERFRRLGIADRVRAAGLPADYPQDIAFRTTMTGRELGRIPIPSTVQRASRPAGPDADWATPEPPHRVNQKYLEPILMEHAAGLPRVTLLNETRYLGLEQDEHGVSVRIADRDGAERVLRGRFLIGADGGRSAVRKRIGAAFHGDPVLQRVQSTCIRAPRLYDLLPGERAWAYYTFNPRRNGHVYAIDGDEVFLVHNYLSAGEGDGSGVDRDAAIRTILGVDASFDYEVVSEEDWIARRLVADRLRDRRVFIAGDAAHLWVPYAGFGMNAGIADVLNLTWALGARIAGWAADGILDAYEAERLPITDQVSRFAMGHQRKIAQGEVPPEIEDATDAGRAARRRLGEQAYALNVEQFAAAGLNYGYSYAHSPVIVYDGEPAPAYTMGSYTESTVPGCRAPHFWLADGVSLYDELGLGYTALSLGDPSGLADLVDEAAAAGVPLKVIDVDRRLAPAAYRHGYVIVRDDQHVVWRADAAPADPRALLDRLRGRLPSPGGAAEDVAGLSAVAADPA